MNLRAKSVVLTFAAFALSVMPARAEPLPPELNVVPPDAGLFVSIRVSDLWNESRLKPLRDFIVEEGRLLSDLEKETGFRPDDVERFSLVCANFDSRRGLLSEPLIVLTFKKPYDLARLLDQWGGMTEAEFRILIEKQGKGGIGFPKGVPFNQPPKAFQVKPAIEPVQELLPEKKPDESDCNQKEDPDDPPGKKKGPRDLKAPYYLTTRGGAPIASGFLVPINERTVVIGMASHFYGDTSLHDLLAVLLKRSAKGPLTPALEAAAGKHSVVLGVNIQAIRAALPETGWVHLLPINTLMKCNSVTGTVDFGQEVRLAFHVDGPDEATAKRMLDVMRSIHILGMESLAGLKNLGDDEVASTMQLLFSFVEPILRKAKFEQKGNTASVVMANKIDEQLAKTIKDAIEKLKETATRARSQNNLKQLALAMHNYESAHGRFPFQGVPGPNGNNPKLSWRVTILPYIEEQPLYNEFRLNEAWDSEHNKKLITKMPKFFAPLGSGTSAPAGHTFYRAFTGPGTFSWTQTFAGVTDGTSNTLLFVEAGESVPWTKPEDFPYDPNRPLPKLGGHFKGKMNVAMGDGSVRTIDLTKVPEHVLRALITANGGEVVGDY